MPSPLDYGCRGYVQPARDALFVAMAFIDLLFLARGDDGGRFQDLLDLLFISDLGLRLISRYRHERRADISVWSAAGLPHALLPLCIFAALVVEKWRPVVDEYRMLLGEGKRFVVRWVIFHPRQAREWIERGLTGLRWATWSMPIYSKLSQLRRRLQRARQARRRRKELRRREKAVAKMRASPKKPGPLRGSAGSGAGSTRSLAAVKLQTAFRARRARREAAVMRQLQGQRVARAAKKLQEHAIRMARRRALRAAVRDAAMVAARDGARTGSRPLAEADREREERKAFKRFLSMQPLVLRPDSPFAVAWESIFVVLVLGEVLQVASRYLTPDCILVPKPTAAGFVPKVAESLRRIRRTRSLAALDSASGVADGCSDGWIPTLGRVLIGPELLALVGPCYRGLVVLFATLDCAVQFSIGAVDEASGVLEPRPFLARWALPPHGLLFHCFVNPGLKAGGRAIGAAARWTTAHHPPRVYRLVVWLLPPVVWLGRASSAALKAVVRSQPVFRRWDLYVRHTAEGARATAEAAVGAAARSIEASAEVLHTSIDEVSHGAAAIASTGLEAIDRTVDGVASVVIDGVATVVVDGVIDGALSPLLDGLSGRRPAGQQCVEF